MEEVLECASKGNLERFKILVHDNPTLIDATGPWTVWSKKSSNYITDDLTPLIVAAADGSLEVVSYILTFPNIDVNRYVGREFTTALHSAASSVSPSAVAIVRELLAAGADSNSVDSYGLKPSDMAFANPCLGQDRKKEIIWLLLQLRTPSSISDDVMMFTFKVHLCQNPYSHNSACCSFYHPGVKDRRRDPRLYYYSPRPCRYFEFGSCKKGDWCKYAHGGFEIGLHPLRYKTTMCARGWNCRENMCFYAHSDDELRNLSNVPLRRPIMHNAVPPLHLPGGNVNSVNRPFHGPRAMPPPNLYHGTNSQYVPGSKAAYGGSNFDMNSNLNSEVGGYQGHGMMNQPGNAAYYGGSNFDMNLNSEVGGYQGHGMMNQPGFRIDDGRGHVVRGQYSGLGDQFHNRGLGGG